jgi:hypothetical protein
MGTLEVGSDDTVDDDDADAMVCERAPSLNEMCVISKSSEDDEDATDAGTAAAADVADGDANDNDDDDEDDAWWADAGRCGVGCAAASIPFVRPRAADDGAGVGVEAVSVERDESSRRWHSTNKCSMPASAA